MRAALLIATAFIAALVCTGCGPPPGALRPLDDVELSDLAERIYEPLSDVEAVRATGTGQMTVSGRTLRFGFALLQSGPSWLRLDIRPDLVGFGSALNSLILVEGACARAYFPARVIEVRGCFDQIFGFPALEGAASLATGFPDASLVESIEGAMIRTEGDALVLRGTLGGSPIELTMAGESGVVTGIRAGDPDAFDEVTIRYEGHGWKDAPPCPRVMSVVAREGTTNETRMRLEFETFRAAEGVDRGRHALPVPPGARLLSWRDLFGDKE
ncbi:MAG: hypothetical protein GF405_06725 [Candidatus Eisenbacteria bacterium]|nr:hypothetical protein [Candidatus Eisenbacteria bacterium]